MGWWDIWYCHGAAVDPWTMSAMSQDQNALQLPNLRTYLGQFWNDPKPVDLSRWRRQAAIQRIQFIKMRNYTLSSECKMTGVEGGWGLRHDTWENWCELWHKGAPIAAHCILHSVHCSNCTLQITYWMHCTVHIVHSGQQRSHVAYCYCKNAYLEKAHCVYISFTSHTKTNIVHWTLIYRSLECANRNALKYMQIHCAAR